MIIDNEPRWVEVDSDGEISKKKYYGKFLIKPFLTHREKADALRLAEKYCLGINQSVEMRLFLTTVAFLNFHIQDFEADWWVGDNENRHGLDLIEENPVYAISNKIKELQYPEEAKKDDPNSDKSDGKEQNSK